MTSGAPEVDYDGLLRANLQQVFNERDDGLRAAAIAKLYVAEPILYDPRGIVEGRAGICRIAGSLLDQFGPRFAHVADEAVSGHHGMAILRWHGGLSGEASVVAGTDVVEVVDGRIARLWVMLRAP